MIAQRARAAALCGMLVAAAALSQEPQPGVEHDSWREIRVAAVAPTDCVEVAAGRHTIRLALADVRAMALDAGAIMGAATEPRLKRIFEGRAQELLGRFAGVSASGCVQALAEGEDRYLIAELLKAGRAGVRRDGAPAPSIWMRHLGKRAGPMRGHGEILFYAERGGEPFFVVSWWVS